MNRKTFALSWGRKIFFGMGWALLSVVALTYLQSKILPQTLLGWVYYITSFIGQYGLMISVLYFVIYYPVIWLLPTYYTSRFFSLILILLSSAALAFDSFLFSQYHFHANGFILNLLSTGGMESFSGYPTLRYFLLIILTLIISLIIWIRGEWLWRKMQTRFSNPVKNWYLLLILVCLLISHGLFVFAEKRELRSITKLSELFPLSLTPLANSFAHNGKSSHDLTSTSGSRDFYYPIKEPDCKPTNGENILMIVVDELSENKLDQEHFPSIHHLKTHGVLYLNHLSGGIDKNGGIFSLFYSLPANYFKSIKTHNSRPLLLKKLAENNYQTAVFSGISVKGNELGDTLFANLEVHEADSNSNYDMNTQTVEAWKNWIHTLGSEKNFFGTILLENVEEVPQVSSLEEKGEVKEKSPVNKIDDLVKSIVTDLYNRKHLSNTIVIITSAVPNESSSKDLLYRSKVPLLILYPDRTRDEVTRISSHYDLVPTLMSEVLDCKKHFEDYSFGKPLRTSDEPKWLILGTQNSYNIIDFEKKLVTEIQDSGKYEVKDFSQELLPKRKVQESVVFDVLKNFTRFYKNP